MCPFPASAPLAHLQFLRSYSRQRPGSNRKESWNETCDRTVNALTRLGHYTESERGLVDRMQRSLKSLPSGRWLWVGGTAWVERRENFYGAYNCSSANITDWHSFGLMMELAMMGCGTGAVLEDRYIAELPSIINTIAIRLVGEPGQIPTAKRQEYTTSSRAGNRITVTVGDSRQGWAASYQQLMEIASDPSFEGHAEVTIDLSHVRPTGEILKGFGGVANPSKLPELYGKVARILNKAHNRRLTSVECCIIIDEAALVVVSGNIRRSAGMRQFSSHDEEACRAKDNLWTQDADGKWRVDPERDSLRMANHTRIFHKKPTSEDCTEAVRKQFYSGEGAIMWAGEAKRRAQGDDRYGLNPCGEIIGSNFLCNLAEVHLNQLDPMNLEDQDDAFRAAALSASALLHHKFNEPRFQKSREEDPIIGISFTGAFNFFSNRYGIEWLRWWKAGRPESWTGSQGGTNDVAAEFRDGEREYFSRWRNVVEATVDSYCKRHGLKTPIRCTTVQPSGSKTLLTGVGACGWHPPKGKWYVRRMTFAKGHPVALAALDYGYSIVPSHADRDANGNLLNDPFDARCTEWLVEVPVEEPWAQLEGAEEIEPQSFSVAAQFDFYMQVQKYYTTHNTSGTFEIFEEEIEILGNLIHRAIERDEGYVSCAILARSMGNVTFPRLPFEPVSREVFAQLKADVLNRRRNDDFMALFHLHNGSDIEMGPEDSACSGALCELKDRNLTRKRPTPFTADPIVSAAL